MTFVLRPLCWTPEAEAPFTELKRRFTSAPILTQPDSSLQFVVEVDASVLSQRSLSDQRLHPCAFFSKRLSPAERNYDVGNWELLAVKMELEEWRHWLKGAELPFVVWTDHKNLEYIHSAKRLNSHQARWTLFFGRFKFTLTYRPGSRNVKPDALSRQFTEVAKSLETILPVSCLVASLTWQVKAEVRLALRLHPDPDRVFVPDPVRPQVLQWGHTSKIACHPGHNRTLDIIQQRFWWLTMDKDTREFVKSCTVMVPYCGGFCDWATTIPR